uniref:CAP domain-containing protein (inferred by orthology to a zebrafish protein) n=1 Tax=Strongyloides venezuelensis TaxID=75913 RepID=A0A0K0FD05_STRVS
MKLCILFLIPINILLSQKPPPLPPKQQHYGNGAIPPQLPSKRFSYALPEQNQASRRHSIIHYTVELHTAIGGNVFYMCNGVTFSNQLQANKYCLMLNNYELKKAKQNQQHRTSFIRTHRNSLSRSNSDLTGRKNSISGLSRSSSKQSLIGSSNSLPSRRHSISGSNRDLSWQTKSISGSIDDLSGRKNSFLKRTGSLSNSRGSLSKNTIGNKKIEETLGKYTNIKAKSYMIWADVWKSCKFKCYSANFYDVYKERALLEINRYRINHKVSFLGTSPQLSVLAQELAEEFLITKKVDVSQYSAYGILYHKATIFSATMIIKNWYDTIAKYNFYFNKPSSIAANSFAQIVWADTTKLGIGIQHDNDDIYVVCVFYPKGNKKGEYKKNVHKCIS